MRITRRKQISRPKYLKSRRRQRRIVGGKYKNLVCSPTVNPGDKVTNESCLTKPILLTLRDEYNKDHSSNPIIATKPILIWHELKMRLSTCNDDRCLLSEIDDVTKREQTMHKLFAPEHPPDWLQNKQEWLSNRDIDSVMPQYEEKYADFKYLGTTSIDYDFKYDNGQCVEDQLCRFNLEEQMKAGKRRFGAVFNLDKHTKGGSHWVSMYFDIDHSIVVFFDSAKGGIPTEINRFIKTVTKQGASMKPAIKFEFKTNKSDHQRGDTECGVYSIHFIIEMLHNFDNLSRFMNGKIPDKEMSKERFKIFNSPFRKTL